MIGVIANTFCVIIGSFLGILLKKCIPEKLSDTLMKTIGLCTIFIGVKGSLQGENTLVVIISLVMGIIIGELLKLDDLLNLGTKKLEEKFSKENNNFSSGFISATLLFCVGSMTIVGSLDAGLRGDNSILFSKSVLDFISSIILSSTFGFSVIISSVSVFIIQGGIVLLSHIISPILSTSVVNEITCVGSILIIALSLNLLNLTKFKIVNYLPAVFMPLVLLPLYNLIQNII